MRYELAEACASKTGTCRELELRECQLLRGADIQVAAYFTAGFGRKRTGSFGLRIFKTGHSGWAWESLNRDIQTPAKSTDRLPHRMRRGPARVWNICFAVIPTPLVL